MAVRLGGKGGQRVASQGERTMKLTQTILAMTSSLFLLSACGGGNGDTMGPDGNRGYTDCGTVQCAPGQYCSDSRFSECTDGCLSDLNCDSAQQCIKASNENEGTCQTGAKLDAGMMMTNTDAGMMQMNDEIARCKEKCTEAQACGVFDVSETVQCNAGCGTLSQLQAKSLNDCVDNAGCTSAILQCYGRECGPKYDCPAGQQCLGGGCL